MGRFFTGDIEGKFWFGVQDSFAPERLGAIACQISFLFEDKDLLEQKLSELKKQIGDSIEKFDKFFAENKLYNDETLATYMNEEQEVVKKKLEIYADIKLGNKVLDYLNKGNDSCEIDCEI